MASKGHSTREIQGLEKDLETSRKKKEKYESLALKARKVLSEEEATSLDSNDEEYAMAKAKEDKKEKVDQRCFKGGDPNHFISYYPKHSFNDQKAFVIGCWSDSEDDSKKEEICLMALADRGYTDESMSSSNDSQVMSSPNHPTTDIKDDFSSNFPDYTMASPNYFPASPRNISRDPLDNLSKYLLASLAISPFHDMQAYNAVANKPHISLQDPITPPTILTPSLVLPPSLLFDP
nr:hypothetical protein [Tanacetum cinerariifolium]